MSSKNSRKLPTWMLEDKPSNKRQKSTKPAPKVPKSPSSTKRIPPTTLPEDPIEIYKALAKPPQDFHARIRKLFKTTNSKTPDSHLYQRSPSYTPPESPTGSPPGSPKSSPSQSPQNSSPDSPPHTPPSRKENYAPKRTGNYSSPSSSPVKYVKREKISPKATPEKKHSTHENSSPPNSKFSTANKNTNKNSPPLSTPPSHKNTPLSHKNISPTSNKNISPTSHKNISPPSNKNISPTSSKNISPTSYKKISPASRKNAAKKSSSDEDLSPTISRTLGNSPLRSPQLSPDRSSPIPLAQNPLLSETELKRVLELDNKSDNDSNYSSGNEGGQSNSDKEESGSENELNEEENDDFEFFANGDSIFDPLPSPDLSGSEEKLEAQTEAKPKRAANFICDQPCSKKAENNNKKLTEALENIQKLHYLYGEQWQELSMRKAITALKRYPATITNINQVKDIPGIGSSITTKIAAFLEGKPIAAKGPPQLDLFGNIWGAGPKSVKSWIFKGYTTLEHLLQDPELTSEQRIGIKYYSAFRTRIPRSEVQEHVAKVAEVVKQMPSSVTASVVAAGSYRRGREDCGDIDVLVLHPSTKPTGVLQDLIGRLHKTHFLIDDLQLSQVKNRDWSHHFDKYMGVSTVGGLPRRIDIMVVPAGSHAATLLYMTGSAYFNRSLRLKSKKNGFYLCNHAVARADINGKRVGPPIPVHSEEDIFALLSTPYQPPHARDW